MFGLSSKKKPSALDEAIDSVTGALFLHEPDTKEYSAVLKKLERLYALKANERRRNRVSPDTLLIVAGNLTGILIIVSYERMHVTATKALNYIKAIPVQTPKQ